MKLLTIWSLVLVCGVVFLLSCSQRAIPVAQDWSSPVKVTESQDGLSGGVSLYKWRDTLIALRWERYYLLNRVLGSNKPWSEIHLTGVPSGYLWAYPAIDQASDRVFFQQGYMENDQLVMNVLVGHTTGSISVQDAVEKQWLTDKRTLFGETGTNVRLNEPGTRDRPYLGLGLINGSDMYIPYCLQGVTYHGGTVFQAEGPFNNGVFHSADSGMIWKMEKISDFDAWLPSICTTKAYYYYLAVSNYQRDLWFARKPVGDGLWDAPKVITTNFCNSALIWKYVAAAEDDTVHLCWLDLRHEKKELEISVFPPNLFSKLGNCEVAYCQRKDTDAGWNKDVILSKGLLYSFSPSMSVEGNKIVVVWAGAHRDDGLTDIYYATSKDGGNTWVKPLKLTDRVKDGITSGAPEVLLLNGVIHLFYIQGQRNSQQLSPGLTLLNQPPWPIYYQQRPFPD